MTFVSLSQLPTTLPSTWPPLSTIVSVNLSTPFFLIFSSILAFASSHPAHAALESANARPAATAVVSFIMFSPLSKNRLRGIDYLNGGTSTVQPSRRRASPSAQRDRTGGTCHSAGSRDCE